MTRPDVHALTGAYALDALDDVERAAVERHLRECSSCEEEATELVATAARMGSAAAVAEPPAGLRARVLAEARVTPQRPVAAGRTSGGAGGAGWRRRAVAAAAALVLVAGSAATAWTVQQRHLRGERATVAAERAQLADIRSVLAAPDVRVVGMATSRGGRISAVYSAAESSAVLTYAALPSQAAGHTYQLWRMRGGVATSVGVLAVGQRAGTTLVRHVGGDDSLALSVEPAGGSPAPTMVYGALALPG